MSKACSLFSGSSGNSIYVGCGDNQILVDIGVSARRCEQKLRQVGADPAEIKGIFVTHEHADHAAGVRVFAARYHIPVFAHPAVLEQMARQGNLNEKVDARPFAEVGDFMDLQVLPFALSHDSVACQGYKFTMPDGRRIAMCTDTGYITSAAKAALPGTDLVFLESNHEPSMVRAGSYPYPLQQRILSDTGHLSNTDCAAFAGELLRSDTTRFVLSHLSRENNMPSLAYQTTVAALTALGRPAGGRLPLAGGCTGAGRRVPGVMIRITVLTVGKLKEKISSRGLRRILKAAVRLFQGAGGGIAGEPLPGRSVSGRDPTGAGAGGRQHIGKNSQRRSGDPPLYRGARAVQRAVGDPGGGL